MIIVVAAVLAGAAGCGGGGHCDNPPCMAPDPTCDSDEDCFESQYCDFAQDSCGTALQDIGHCTRRPTSCTGEVQLTCGCDGQMHSNPCVAASQGADVNVGGGCSLPPNAFGCGASACDKSEQICFDSVTGGGGADSHFFRCESFPDQCKSNRTCACLAQFGCGKCEETGGGFTLECMLVPDPAASE